MMPNLITNYSPNPEGLQKKTLNPIVLIEG